MNSSVPCALPGRQAARRRLPAYGTSSGGVTSGLLRTAAKRNEITAIPELLQTLDAPGCHREIV